MVLAAASTTTPDWLTLVGAIGVGALLASIVQAGVALMNGKSDRSREWLLRTGDRTHETELRRLDQQHEERLLAMADRRAVRDRRAARIYSNLKQIVELVITVRDQAQRLRLYPQDFRKTDPNLKKVVERFAATRPALLLDSETTALFDRTGDAIRLWNSFWVALESKEDARKSGERLGDYTKQIAGSGSRSSAR